MEKDRQATDYAAMLDDMEAKKAALETAISSLRAALGAGALGVTADVPPGVVSAAPALRTLGEPGSLPRGAFLGKTSPEAIKLYLSTVRQKKTNKEIGQALQEHGMESTGKKFDTFINHSLFRLKKQGVVLRFDDGWGLAEWYPEPFRNRLSQDKSKLDRKRSKAKPKKQSAQRQRAKPIATPRIEAKPAVPKNGHSPIGTQERIKNLLLASAPDAVMPDAIAKQVGIPNVKVASMMLGKLVSKGLAEKTASGGYRSTEC